MYLADISMNNLKDFEYEQLEAFIMELLNDYEKLGPLPGILLPFIEAFLPFLPLFVFVFANAAAYGLLKGFLLFWAGSVLGSIIVFLIISKLGGCIVFY